VRGRALVETMDNWASFECLPAKGVCQFNFLRSCVARAWNIGMLLHILSDMIERNTITWNVSGCG
jgi:hypothetical protein